MDKPIRRIVTGHDGAGASTIISDAEAANRKYPGYGTVSTLIWSSDQSPADIAVGRDVEDMGARVLGSAPPPRGTRFCVIDFPPDAPGYMHRTDSLDYAIVLSGEVVMQMDDSEVRLAAGDVVVQRGTNHAFRNDTAFPVRIAFVLIDAKPLPIGSPVSGLTTAGPGDHAS